MILVQNNSKNSDQWEKADVSQIVIAVLTGENLLRNQLF